jgi:hypothetical protein
VKPIKFQQANGVLTGTGGIEDLPVCRTTDGNVCSCWHIPFWKRIQILFLGRVFLVVKGKTHPPLWIDTKAF